MGKLIAAIATIFVLTSSFGVLGFVCGLLIGGAIVSPRHHDEPDDETEVDSGSTETL